MPHVRVTNPWKEDYRRGGLRLAKGDQELEVTKEQLAALQGDHRLTVSEIATKAIGRTLDELAIPADIAPAVAVALNAIAGKFGGQELPGKAPKVKDVQELIENNDDAKAVNGAAVAGAWDIYTAEPSE